MHSTASAWDPLFYPHLEPLIPPRELWVGPGDPLVHFLRWSWEYRSYLILLCALRRDSHVLELGCNHGRTMLSLVDYLHPPGRYEGLDILPAQIEFAQQNIQTRFPFCRFTRADVHSQIYNPGGRVPAQSYVFPYPDACFDVVYAASLFTHLLPEASANYLMQTRRVLTPGGRCLFSFFLLDFYRGPGTSVAPFYELDHPLEGHPGIAVRDPSSPEQLVAYDAAAVERLAAQAGLRVERIIPGCWSNAHETCLNEQDLVVLSAA